MSNLLGRFFGKRDPEKNSGVPVAVPGGERPMTMQEMIKKYIREEIRQDVVHGDQAEDFDEADDFDEDDPEVIPLTHHQVFAMSDQELRDHAAAYGLDAVDHNPHQVAGDTPELPAGSPGGSKASNPAQPAPPPPLSTNA